MSTFLLDSGRLAPVTHEGIIPDGFNPAWCDLVRQDVLDLVGLDAFAVAWDQGTPALLTAMHATGAVVGAAVLPRLDLVTLAELLARAGQANTQPWQVTAGHYEAGMAAFRRDWNAFREARSLPVAPVPALVVVTGSISAQVRQALPLLAGVHLVRAQVRQDDRGRHLLDLDTVAGTGVSLSRPGARGAPADADVTPRANRASATSNGTATQSTTGTAPSGNRRARRARREERDVPTAITAPTPPDAGARPGPVVAEAARTGADSSPGPDTPPGPDAHRPVDAEQQEGCPDLQRVAVLVRAPVQIELQYGRTRRQATLRSGGRVVLADGTVYTDLARAGAHLAGAEPADPWQAWRFSDANLPLADARAEAQRYLTTHNGAGSPVPSVHGRRVRL